MAAAFNENAHDSLREEESRANSTISSSQKYIAHGPSTMVVSLRRVVIFSLPYL